MLYDALEFFETVNVKITVYCSEMIGWLHGAGALCLCVLLTQPVLGLLALPHLLPRPLKQEAHAAAHAAKLYDTPRANKYVCYSHKRRSEK